MHIFLGKCAVKTSKAQLDKEVWIFAGAEMILFMTQWCCFPCQYISGNCISSASLKGRVNFSFHISPNWKRDFQDGLVCKISCLFIYLLIYFKLSLMLRDIFTQQFCLFVIVPQSDGLSRFGKVTKPLPFSVAPFPKFKLNGCIRWQRKFGIEFSF